MTGPDHDKFCEYHGEGTFHTRPCTCDFLAKVRADERAGILALIREVHYPRTDPGYSLVTWEYCSCGASEVFTAEDGYPSIGPARYPCATVRALSATEEP